MIETVNNITSVLEDKSIYYDFENVTIKGKSHYILILHCKISNREELIELSTTLGFRPERLERFVNKESKGYVKIFSVFGSTVKESHDIETNLLSTFKRLHKPLNFFRDRNHNEKTYLRALGVNALRTGNL